MVTLQNHVIPPHAFVLESPFNNLRDLLHQYPLVRLFRFLPHFESALLSPLEQLHGLIYYPGEDTGRRYGDHSHVDSRERDIVEMKF